MRTRPFLPFQQGDLDNLCGLYCIVNAVAVALRRPQPAAEAELLRSRRFADHDADRLFEELARAADRCIGLQSVFERGIKTPIFGKLLASGNRHLSLRHATQLFWSKPYHNQKTVEPSILIRRLQRHLEAPHTAAIIGYKDHWSVVSSVTPRRLILADSSNDRWLVAGRRGQKPHGVQVREIWPTSVFLIRLAPLPAGRA